MWRRLNEWWGEGDPAPAEIAFAVFLLAVAWFIAEFGGGQ